MARPTSKAELLQVSSDAYKKLISLVSSYSDSEREADFPEGTMNRNIRDVLAHLHHWHLLMLDWYRVGMSGAKPEMLAPGYSWKTVPALNFEIWRRYQISTTDSVLRMLDESYAEIQKVIAAHTDEDLFAKRRYRWTGSTSLVSYLVSASSSHYDWAYRLIKKMKKGHAESVVQ